MIGIGACIGIPFVKAFMNALIHLDGGYSDSTFEYYIDGGLSNSVQELSFDGGLSNSTYI